MPTGVEGVVASLFHHLIRAASNSNLQQRQTDEQVYAELGNAPARKLVRLVYQHGISGLDDYESVTHGASEDCCHLWRCLLSGFYRGRRGLTFDLDDFSLGRALTLALAKDYLLVCFH